MLFIKNIYIYNIPYFEYFAITEEGIVYDVSNKNSVLQLEKILKGNISFVKINNELVEIGLLLAITFIGLTGFNLNYQDGNSLTPTRYTVTYEIPEYTIEDEYLIFKNGTLLKKVYDTDLFISQNGFMFNPISNSIRHPSINKKTGYYSTNIGGKKISLHRLIWSVWRGNIRNKMVIDHLNGRKCDNQIPNFEEVTSAVNNLRAFDNGLKEKVWDSVKLDKICMLMEIGLRHNCICDALHITDPKERIQLTRLLSLIAKGEYKSSIIDKYDLTKYRNEKYHYRVVPEEVETIIYGLFDRGFGVADIARITNYKYKTIAGYRRKYLHGEVKCSSTIEQTVS